MCVPSNYANSGLKTKKKCAHSRVTNEEKQRILWMCVPDSDHALDSMCKLDSMCIYTICWMFVSILLCV